MSSPRLSKVFALLHVGVEQLISLIPGLRDWSTASLRQVAFLQKLTLDQLPCSCSLQPKRSAPIQMNVKWRFLISL